MVIIEVRNSGKVIGRCDGSCYNATGPECTCCCGGVNHGVGEKIAREDRQHISDEDILANIPYPLERKSLTVSKPLLQMELF